MQNLRHNTNKLNLAAHEDLDMMIEQGLSQECKVGSTCKNQISVI